MTSVALAGASALRDAYLHRELTPAELVDEVVSAPDLDGVWITRVTPDALRARAAELTARDPADLPLFGIPFAVKDNIDVAGLPTTAGCPGFAYRPDRTAPAVERLLAAGAILVGKTNLDQFATGLTGSRSPYGAVESVFGGGLIAGGSSSGSAVAVAAGQVAFALGTDTAGSGRVPAALNGIVGLKPTRGLISTLGIVPACRSLDCVSIFALDVADAAAVLGHARGVTPGDPWSRTGRLGWPDATSSDRPSQGGARPAVDPGAVRLGVARPEHLDFEGDRGQAERYVVGSSHLVRLVERAEPVDLTPLLEAGALLYQGPWVAERLADLAEAIDAPGVLPLTREIIQGGARFSAVDVFRAQHRLAALKSTVDEMWRRIDALVLPTVPTTFTLAEIAAEPLAHNLVLGRYTQFVNLLDLAAVSVPNGFTPDGRPASLTLIGPAFSEPTLLRLAATYQGDDPGPPAHPGTVELAVVGHHLRGEARNGELVALGGTFVRTTRTQPAYRLFSLPHVPGLVRVNDGGVAIEVELWRLPSTAVGELLAGIPAPLSLGRVSIVDGEPVVGFLCEAYAVHEGRDISGHGGWRAYRRMEGL